MSKKKGTLFGKPINQVIKRPGAFRAKAQAAGMSTSAFASKVLAEGSNYSTRTKRQAALAKTLMKMEDGGYPHPYPMYNRGGAVGQDILGGLTNTIAMPFEMALGTDLYNYNPQTQVGQTVGKVQDTLGQVGSYVAPMALNYVAPGAGTALSVGRKLTGSMNPNSFKDSYLTGQQAGQIGQAAGLAGQAIQYFKHGGYPIPMPKMHPVEVEGGEMLNNGSKYKGPSHSGGGIKTVLPSGSMVIPKKYTKEYEAAKNRKDGVRTKSIERTVENNQIQRLKDVKATKFKKAGLKSTNDGFPKMQSGGYGELLIDNNLNPQWMNQSDWESYTNYSPVPENMQIQNPQVMPEVYADQTINTPLQQITSTSTPQQSEQGVNYGKLASTALQYAPAALNAYYASRPVEEVMPVYNPYESQIRDYIDRQRIDRSALKARVAQSYNTARANLRNAGSISSGAYRSNIGALAAQQANAQALTDMQAQEAENALLASKAGAYGALGQSRQQADLLANQMYSQALANQRGYAQAAAKDVQGALNTTELYKLWGRQFPVTQIQPQKV